MDCDSPVSLAPRALYYGDCKYSDRQKVSSVIMAQLGVRSTMTLIHRRSFVYFGSGSPCAMLGTEDTPIPPQWGPPIPIYPVKIRDSSYATWNLRLLSMTLLVPRVESPDFASLDDWDPIEIVLPSLDGLEGLNVVLDTCTFTVQAASTALCCSFTLIHSD